MHVEAEAAEFEEPEAAAATDIEKLLAVAALPAARPHHPANLGPVLRPKEQAIFGLAQPAFEAALAEFEREAVHRRIEARQVIRMRQRIEDGGPTRSAAEEGAMAGHEAEPIADSSVERREVGGTAVEACRCASGRGKCLGRFESRRAHGVDSGKTTSRLGKERRGFRSVRRDNNRR